LVVAAMRHALLRRRAKILAVGPREALIRAGWTPKLGPLLDPGISVPTRSRPGPSAAGGRASFAAVRLAVRLAQDRRVDAVVTAPVSKQSWEMAKAGFRDHTEYLKAATGSRDVGMMLLAGDLRAVLVTRHIPHSEIPARLTASALSEAARLTVDALRRSLAIRKPRLGLCALNPHAGDDGILGTEEKRVLAPWARRQSRQGFSLEGPLPADAAWAAHKAGRFDALLAAYHDQALIPLKLSGGYGVVNWTLGIPIIRTSPGHGTAFDLAGKGKVDPKGMLAAALFAVRLASSS
jgi:4-hydroxythreonine-4-phosphate dehydrogenase